MNSRGSPIGFFYPVIPTQIFGQSRNPEGYFWHPTSRAYFQSRISHRFPFKIPNPKPQIREIRIPKNLLETLNSRQRLSFSFPEQYSLVELNSKKYGQHLTNWTTWNKRDKVWSSASPLFKCLFRSRRRRCCLTSLKTAPSTLFLMALEEILVKDKITASCERNMSPKHHFERNK